MYVGRMLLYGPCGVDRSVHLGAGMCALVDLFSVSMWVLVKGPLGH